MASTEDRAPGFGVCYYPEQWPRAAWAADAAAMRKLGIRHVRIGEFAWAVVEPQRGVFKWDVLDGAIQALAAEGLTVVLGTPTACPPKWLVDEYPDILPVDANGHVRRFGSRRHYNFCSATYLRETERIVTLFAERYGRHPAVGGWQLDNEFGCHDTVMSFCDETLACFRAWLAARYADVSALNAAWGNAFWSMDYGSFDEIGLPNLTVTEANPAHWLDFRRFASEQVAAYARLQESIVRRLSPGRFVTTNMMGFFTQFDHFALGECLDFAAWDSYPLGFTDTAAMPRAVTDADKLAFARTGHPDIAAFHHDLYRGVGRGRFWVMEQQPGPVNWATNNPSPAAGMVRLWTLEAVAHGADVVSYFRWRQCPFAQEQMHSGLNRPDYSPDVATGEVADAVKDLATLGPHIRGRSSLAPAALVFDYEAAWVIGTQPQGALFSYMEVVLIFYTSLRRLGLDVDIVPPGADLAPYGLVVVPSSPIVRPPLVAQLASFRGCAVLGPRTGSKTADFQIPPTLPPGASLQDTVIPVRVVRVESLRDGLTVGVTRAGIPPCRASVWVEHLEPVKGAALQIEATFEDGRPAVVSFAHDGGRCHYVGFYPDVSFLTSYVASVSRCTAPTSVLSTSLRTRRRGSVVFAFNYDAACNAVAPAASDATFVVGGRYIPPCGVSAWLVQ